MRCKWMIICVEFILVAFLCVCSSSPLLAQQTITSATLSGRVEDARGASVRGASVSITNRDQNQTWTTTTDEQGRFRVSYLPVGMYRLKVEHQGFALFTRAITLSVGQALEVPVKLSVAGLVENVDVVADVPLVEAGRTQLAETVLPRDIDGLPLNGRNYLDLALLSPAVSRTNTGNNQFFAETSAVPGTGISIAGQRNLNNSFIVDGLSANDDAAALAGTFYSQEVIREFQVVTSGGIAEFGRASSGIVNIITQSGANQWRGRLYGYLRNQRLDARNPLATRKDPLTQTQYGASLGGPLRPDRTFLFSNFEQTRQNRAGIITISPTNVSAINQALDQINYRGPRLQTGEFPSGYDATNFFARLDQRLGATTQVTARYSFYDISSVNARNVGGLNAVSRATGLDDHDQTIAVNATTTLSQKTINEARFQFSRSRLAAPVNDLVGPAINIAGVANFGTATFSPTKRAIDLIEIVDNVSTQRIRQTLKGGVSFLYNRVNITFPGALQGVYSFSSIVNFQAGRYTTFQQAFGAPEQFQSNPNLGMFVQDEWRLRRNFTINAGLRYDLQWLPDPIKTDANNVAPRIGIAYAVGGYKTVIRASYGLYYDRTPLRAVSNALQRDGIKYKVAVLSFGQAGAPGFPGVLATFPTGLLTSITTIDPRIENSYSQQADLQIERQLSPTTSLSVGYLHLRGLHIIMSRNVNVPTLSAADAARLGVPNLGRPDPRFANVGRFEGTGDSYYNAMTVSLNKRASSWAGVRFSYTLSKAIDNAGNFFFSTPQNNFNLRDDRGLSDNDQRHRVTVSGSLDGPSAANQSGLRRMVSGFRLSYILSYSAALPFNILTGTDRNNDTNVNDRPVGVGRNTGRGFNFASFDLRLGRTFHFTERVAVEAMVESFNTLNRTNFQFPNNVFGPGPTPLATFRRPTGAADSRQIQFGLRFSF